jgi:hypothetical protein
MLPRHPGESRDPALKPFPFNTWIPAFAGMTAEMFNPRKSAARQLSSIFVSFVPSW